MNALSLARQLRWPKKLLYLALVCVGLLMRSPAYATSEGEILVVLSGFETNQGFVLVSLHDQKKSFPDDAKKAKKLARAQIKNKRAVLRFKGLTYGRYAISAFHDENDNRKLDTNFLGIPKEAVGASNNAKGTLGPPKWKDAVFELKGPSVTQKIKLERP